jgi:hypothetical protein
VIANKKALDRYLVTVPGWCGYVKVSDDNLIRVVGGSGRDCGYWVDPDCFDLVTENSKIVITHDGKTTLARRYVNGKVVERAEAKCSPEDKFDFVVGATLAYDRLIEKATGKKRLSPETVEALKKPEYWSGRVVCTSTDDPDHDFIVGNVYRCVAGKLIDENGNDRPGASRRLEKSDFAPGGYCDHWLYRFVPLNEDCEI